MTYEPVSLESLMSHQGWALRVARSLVHEEGEAEDLVQRTWLAALRRPPESASGARAWIRKVILNLARERHRRKLARERVEHEALRSEVEGEDASTFASSEEIRALLGERLMQLGEPYRAVLIERFYEGRTSAEIARRMGIPSGTVRWRLKVGLDQLRLDLDRRCKGDRSRWVSAMLLWLPKGVPERPREARPDLQAAVPTSTGVLPALAWLTLAGLGVLGVVLLTNSTSRRGSNASGVVVAATIPEPELARAGPRPDAGDRIAGPMHTGPAPTVEAVEAGLRIQVVDEVGEPVPGAQLLVIGANGMDPRGETGADGWVWLPVGPDDPGALGLPATRERVSVRAVAPGHAASPMLHIGPPFDAGHEARLVLGGPGGTIEGSVLGPDEKPIQDALVAWFEPLGLLEGLPEGDFPSPSYLTARTDETGHFRLQHLPQHIGHLGCFAPGFVSSSQILEFLPARAPITVRLAAGASVEGLVRWPGGRPAANVEVAFEPTIHAMEWATGLPGYDASMRGFTERARTDADGRYRIDGVNPSRPRTVWARDLDSGLSASITPTLEPGRVERWDPELSSGPAFRIRVVDERQQPLAGWFVHVRRMEGSEWWIRRRPTDAEGRVVIQDCPPGQSIVDVFDPTDVGASYAWTRLDPSQEEKVIQVTVEDTCTLSGQVVDAQGRPELRGELVLHSLVTALFTPVQRDELGRFEQHTVPAWYALVLEMDHTAVQVAELKLRPGEVHSLGVLATPPMGTLRLDGTALFNGGERLPFFTIALLSKNSRAQGILKLKKGWFDDEAVFPCFPGDYKVMAFDGARSKPRAHTVTVESYAESRLDLSP